MNFRIIIWKLRNFKTKLNLKLSNEFYWLLTLNFCGVNDKAIWSSFRNKR